MSDAIQYSILPSNAGAHLFEVTVSVPAPDEAGQVFRLPAWIPGSYLIRDFARNVVSTEASCDGEPVTLEQLDKSSWQAAPCDGPLRLTIEVYAQDLSVRGAHFDSQHAYFNGPAVFPAVVGQESRPIELEIRPPAGGIGQQWRVATAMNRAGAEPYGYGGYQAADYWELIDHPVEIGDFVLGEFEVNGIPHAIAFSGHDSIDTARICKDLAEICGAHHELLGAPGNLDRYLFLMMVVGKGYGGLEHRWSSSNMCSRDDLPLAGSTEVTSSYRKFLGLCSHEYFHLWNVTRMKPAAFTPYDLSREAYTGLMWVFEGITSYYDDLALARSGRISPDSYLELLGQVMTRVERNPGRHRQTLEQSSVEAWSKFYKQDSGSPNFIVSYYAKGSLMALALDLKLRSETNGRCSLDDVMRECWRQYGETGEGMPERGLESVAQRVSGLDLSEFFERYVRGTGELPLQELLQAVGVRLSFRPATDSKDVGGKPAPTDAQPACWIGSNLSVTDGRSVFGPVLAGSPAELAGVSPGDEIVALDGLKVSAANLDARLAAFKPGDSVGLAVFRRDELMKLSLTLVEPPATTCYLTLDEDADADAAARRDAWLKP